MPKRSSSNTKRAASPGSKAARSASGTRKRAPKVVYAEPTSTRNSTAPKSLDISIESIPIRSEEHKASTFKVMCWNVASLRSIEKDDAAILRRMVEREQPDILVLNEHKLSEELLDLTPPEDAKPATAASSAGQSSMLGFLVPSAKAPAITDAETKSAKIIATAAAASAAASADDDDDDDDDDAAATTAPTGSGSKRSQVGKKQKQQLKLLAAKAASAKGKAAGAKPKKQKKAAVRFSARNIFGPDVFEHETWACSTKKKGYAGVALFSKTKPLKASTGVGNNELDAEGRAVVAEWPGLAVVGVYVPNSGQNLARLSYRTKVWDPAFGKMIRRLEEERGRVLVIGDMNVAIRDLDVYAPQRMRNKNAGFCDAERSNFASLIAPKGVMYGPPPPRTPGTKAPQESTSTSASPPAPNTPAPVASSSSLVSGSAVIAEGSSYSDVEAIDRAASSAEPGIFGSPTASALAETAQTVTVVAPPQSSSAAAAASSAAAAAAASEAAGSTRHLPPPPIDSPAAYATDISQSCPGLGLVDTWACQAENVGVSEWSFFSMRFGMRPKNKGWRIDYALASEKLWPSVTASYIRAKAIGSDHLPIGVEFDRDVLSKAP